MAVSVMAGIPALKDIQQQLKTRMEKAVDDFRGNLASTRTGRASVHMLDQVKVPYYGTDTPLNQVAQVTAPEANLILVQPWDPSILGDIEKALRTSDLGFNPQNDGKIVRIPDPSDDGGAPPRSSETPQQNAGGPSHRGTEYSPRRQ